MSHQPPRIAPGSAAEIGRVNAAIAWVLGRVVGTGPPNVFTTLARHRRLFRPWLRFAGSLMPRGALPRADTELLILRTAHNCRCEYEWRQHERIGRRAGLTDAQLAKIAGTPGTAGTTGTLTGFSERQQLLLRAADELHAQRELSEGLWSGLRPILSDVELIELLMLVGHYEMLAMTLNTLRVEPDR